MLAVPAVYISSPDEFTRDQRDSPPVDRGGRTVLDDLTFTIPRGAVTGLLGPSGCGKTTLIRAIVGVAARASAARSTVLGRAGRQHRPAFACRLRHAGPGRVRRPDRAREPRATSRAVLGVPAGRSGPRARSALADRAGQLGRRASPAASAPASRWRRALLGAPRAARARRADGRARPGAAARPLAARSATSPPRGTTLLVSQPRHGRGRPLRPAAADARRARSSPTSSPDGPARAHRRRTTSRRRSCA